MTNTLAISIITRALEKALRQDSANSPFTSSELSIAMDEMNDMITEWSNGYHITLGYNTVVNTSDETNLPAFSLGAVKNNLALRLSNEFGRPLTQGMVLTAKDSIEGLLNRLIKSPVVLNSPIGPLGSGNCTDGGYRRKFYGDPTADDLDTEGDQTITTERNYNLETDTIPHDPNSKI